VHGIGAFTVIDLDENGDVVDDHEHKYKVSIPDMCRFISRDGLHVDPPSLLTRKRPRLTGDRTVYQEAMEEARTTQEKRKKAKAAQRRESKQQSPWVPYFKPVKDDRVKCSLCERLLKFSTGQSTSTLKRHMETKHKETFLRVMGGLPEDDANKKTRQKVSVQQLTKPQQRKSNALLAEVILTGGPPFAIIECPEFKAFCEALNPEYRLPCRKTLQNIMFSMQGQAGCAFEENIR